MRLFTMLAWWVYFTVFLPLCSCELFGYVDNSDDLYTFLSNEISEEADLIDALGKVLHFFFSDSERVNIDGLLGIVIAEGQLNMVLQKLVVKSMLFEKILKLQNKCHNLIKILKSKVKISSDAYSKIYFNILNTQLWEFDQIFVNGSLKNYVPYNWTEIPIQTLIKRMVYQGTPNGKQSEICITELIDLKNDDNENEHDCVPSLGCTTIMSQLDKSHGYPLTHKLLYIQLAKSLQCKIDDQVVDDSIRYLCSRILKEFRAIENIPNKHVLLQDLYLEQMVLCGLQGFSEFLSHISREHILLWQSTYGCYGHEVPQLSDRWRIKREISRMKFGCESHITGLAAAAIAVNLNFLISTNPPNHLELDSSQSSEEDYRNILMLTQ